jgi:hypothetical protein
MVDIAHPFEINMQGRPGGHSLQHRRQFG